MIKRKISSTRDRTRNEDIPELLAMAEAVGWKIEADGAGEFTLRSPVGKHGDWATVQIRINPGGRRHVWTLTRRQYHAPRKGDRGLMAALRVLNPEEQWRYKAEFPDPNAPELHSLDKPHAELPKDSVRNLYRAPSNQRKK